VFQLSTLKKLDKDRDGQGRRTPFYDPVDQGDRGDARRQRRGHVPRRGHGRIVARLKMPTKKLEASAADGHGNMFIAIRDRNSVIKVDMRAHAMVGEHPANCEEANGLAIDRERQRLFVGCRGKDPVLSVMDAASGKVVATPRHRARQRRRDLRTRRAASTLPAASTATSSCTAGGRRYLQAR
jgi:hypothetical protein